MRATALAVSSGEARGVCCWSLGESVSSLPRASAVVGREALQRTLARLAAKQWRSQHAAAPRHALRRAEDRGGDLGVKPACNG